jgi:hypothetical protein
MKLTSLFLVAVVTIAFWSRAADARPHPHGFGGSEFEANKKFGLGLELGDIAGLTGKYFVTSNQAFDFGIGDLYDGYYINRVGGGIHLYADYLWHPVVLAKPEAFELPFYVGIGGRFWSFGYNCGGGMCASAEVFGVRVPLGIDFDFNNVPLDVYIQFVPTFDFFNNYGPHDVYLDVDFTVGIRYWFS